MSSDYAAIVRDQLIVDAAVNEVLNKHGIGRRTQPICRDCRVPMRHIKDDIWQCPRCKTLEVC